MSRPEPATGPARRPRRDCDICCGEGTVRLMVYKQASRFQACDSPTAIDEAYRLYACPECTGAVPAERARVLEQHVVVTERIKDPRYHESQREKIAHHMAAHLLKENFIAFERTQTGDAPPSFRDPEEFILRGRLGFVTPHFVKSLDERVQEHQTVIARQVVKAAKANIKLWGSSLGWDAIGKDEACRQVEQSIHDVLEHRARWRPA